MELLGCRLLLEGYWDEGEHLFAGHEACLWLCRAYPAVLASCIVLGKGVVVTEGISRLALFPLPSLFSHE